MAPRSQRPGCWGGDGGGSRPFLKSCPPQRSQKSCCPECDGHLQKEAGERWGGGSPVGMSSGPSLSLGLPGPPAASAKTGSLGPGLLRAQSPAAVLHTPAAWGLDPRLTQQAVGSGCPDGGCPAPEPLVCVRRSGLGGQGGTSACWPGGRSESSPDVVTRGSGPRRGRGVRGRPLASLGISEPQRPHPRSGDKTPAPLGASPGTRWRGWAGARPRHPLTWGSSEPLGVSICNRG